MASAKNRNGSLSTGLTGTSVLLSEITPSRSPALSANLFRWLRSHGREGDTVYRLEAGGKLGKIYGAGTLFIGQPYTVYAGDTDFSGVLLMSVLCNGSRAKRLCLKGLSTSLVEVTGFWDRYKAVGRCAIDENHSVGFRDDAHRFEVKDGQHICTWCTAFVPPRAS